jgi:chorismate mutase / prephenate dehydratase
MSIDHQLKPLREKIDAVDAQILALLNSRAELAQQVGHLKANTNATVYRAEREAQVLRNVAEKNKGPLKDLDIQLIFREIMSACRALERRVTVAYLGPSGTFSEQAVFQQFGHAIVLLPCVSIDEVFRTAEAGTADFGVVPIENSTEGAVNRTLDLLLQTSLTISGELSIPIQHSLMTATGDFSTVTKICAHSQALAQCQAWLNQHYPNIERIAVASNGEAARLASLDSSIAAIAGETAGNQYELQVVHAHIQDDPHNRTRFAVIGNLHCAPSGKDQTSVVLAVPNKAGAVYSLIAPFMQFGVSMTRFESRPARTGTWEYYFYIDVEGHQQDDAVARSLNELKNSAAFFRVLGSYPLSA